MKVQLMMLICLASFIGTAQADKFLKDDQEKFLAWCADILEPSRSKEEKKQL